MSKTIHYYHGCPWANGEIQQADTEQVTDLNKVTCKHCQRRISTAEIRRKRKGVFPKLDKLKPTP